MKLLAPDMPDDYPWLPGSSRFPLSDMGELAARLGSPARYDRRGEVIWYDEGKNGIAPWSVFGSGAGNGAYVTCEETYMSPYAIRMKAGSDGGLYSGLVKFLSPATVGKIGIEVAVYFITVFDNFSVRLVRTNGVTWYDATIYLNCNDGSLELRDKNNVKQVIDTGFGNFVQGGQYHQVKLVVDMENFNYFRLLFNQHEYRLIDYPLWSFAAADLDGHRAYLRHTGRPANNDMAVIGHVIITANEL